MGGAMARYKFKGYTITNCGYHQPDHCVWWEAVDENGEACFHGHSLREVEFEIIDYEWEQKIRAKDEEIERLKRSARVGRNAAAMLDAMEKVYTCVDDCYNYDPESKLDEVIGIADAALSSPPRNCDLKECSTNDGMISAHERFCESWHDDGKTCADCPYNPRSQKMTCREKWLLSQAAEREGEN